MTQKFVIFYTLITNYHCSQALECCSEVTIAKSCCYSQFGTLINSFSLSCLTTGLTVLKMRMHWNNGESMKPIEVRVDKMGRHINLFSANLNWSLQFYQFILIRRRRQFPASVKIIENSCHWLHAMPWMFDDKIIVIHLWNYFKLYSIRPEEESDEILSSEFHDSARKHWINIVMR